VQIVKKQVAKNVFCPYLIEININKLLKTCPSPNRSINPVKKPGHFKLNFELLTDNYCHRIGTEDLTLCDAAGDRDMNP
jgi:hypothetical protein